MTAFIPALLAASLTLAGPAPVAALPAFAATGVTWSTANSDATGDQDTPAIATDRNGYVAVVWEDDRDTTNPGDNAHSEVYLRLFQNGTAKYEVKLSGGGTAGTTWRHLSPDVGLDDKGNAVVVWAEDADGNGAFNIQYRVVDTAGTVTGSGRANASTAGNQILPRVAVDPDGTSGSATAVAFTVVWEDIQSGASATVRAAGYTNVTTKAYEVAVSQSTGAHHNPDVAVSASGDALVVWDEDADANGYYNIGLTRLARANGAITLTRRSANSFGGGQQRHACVAANFTGEFTVAWESDHTGAQGIWVRSFAADGTPRSAEVAASTSTGASAPSAGIDDQDGVVVGWTVPGTNPDVWLHGFNADGTDTGRLNEQLFEKVATGRQEQLALAVSAWGEIAAAYTDDNDGNGFDQIYLGLGALDTSW